MTLSQMRDMWIDAHGHRPHLTWWLRLVLTNLCEKSRASVRFDQARLLWSRIK